MPEGEFSPEQEKSDWWNFNNLFTRFTGHDKRLCKMVGAYEITLREWCLQKSTRTLLGYSEKRLNQTGKEFYETLEATPKEVLTQEELVDFWVMCKSDSFSKRGSQEYKRFSVYLEKIYHRLLQIGYNQNELVS